MHAHDHAEPQAESLHPAGSRSDERPEAQLMAAAATGRRDVLGPDGLRRLQRAVGNGATTALMDDAPSVAEVTSRPGSPLPSATRAEMEQRLGADFGDVRVHTDGDAHASAASVNAHAYTVGNNVVFGRGNYDPDSHAGKTMLAHELTHVIQQRSGPVEGTDRGDGVAISDPSDRFEREAAANADRVMQRDADESADDEQNLQGAFVQRDVDQDEEQLQGAFIQRDAAPTAHAAPAAHAKPIANEDGNSYVDMLNCIQDLDVAAFSPDGTHLSPAALVERISAVDLVGKGRMDAEQRATLLDLRTALIGARTDGKEEQGLALFEKAEATIRAALPKAQALGIPAEDISHVADQLNDVSKQLMVPAAYKAAHGEAMQNTTLERPDEASGEAALKQAVDDFNAAEALAEHVTNLTGEAVMKLVADDFPMGKDIIELVKFPGTAAEKMKKAGQMDPLLASATVVDLVGKFNGAMLTIVKTSCLVMKRYSEAREAVFIARGAKELAKEAKESAEFFDGGIKTVETLSKAVAVVSVVADSLKMINAIAKGRWGEVVDTTVDLAVDAVPLVAGEAAAEVAAPLAAVGLAIKAEVVLFETWAEIAKWCHDQQFRNAAGNFIDGCRTVYQNVAADFVGDIEVYFSSSDPLLRDAAMQQMTSHGPGILQGLTFLSGHVASSDPQALGGHPDLVKALGPEAVSVLSGDLAHPLMPDDPFGLADAVKTVFAGANNMSRYVARTYPEKKETKD